jgi:nucleotide-binding universal stress UspA family protein
MPRILCCTDGSVYAPSVYDHTAWAASRTGSSVEVLHVLDHARERAVVDLTGSIGMDEREDLLERLADLDNAKAKLAQEQARFILADARVRLETRKIKAITLSQRHGSLVEALPEFEENADLVVIGKRGEHANFDTLHLGGNLERVVRASHKPVLVAARSFKPISRLLIAFDGSPSARRAVEYAARQPLLKGLDCHLLMVNGRGAAHEESVTEATDLLSQGGFAVTPVARQGEPDEVIAEHVRQESIDLLVMGAYGHSRIRQFIVGSTTTTMVRTCQIPLLMFR